VTVAGYRERPAGVKGAALRTTRTLSSITVAAVEAACGTAMKLTVWLAAVAGPKV